MSLPFNITNPGIYIAGLLTSGESTFVTDLVNLSYANGDILYHDGTNLTNLAASTNGFVLTLAGGVPTWASGSAASSPLTTKGDLYGYAATDARVPVGADGQVLIADSAQALGVKWGAAGVGDMLKSVYDPINIAADVFNMGSMIETPTEKILTATERTLISTAEQAANKDQVNGYAGLDGSGKINTSQLPALAVSEFLGNFTSTTTALADAGVQASQRGDWFTVDTNGGETWFVTTDSPTTTAHITLAKTPTDGVTSVFGRTGAVTAQSGDYTPSQVGADPIGTDNSTDVTLAGTPNYITIVGQVITRALINLTSHVTGILPIANGGTASSTASGARTALGAGTMSNVVEDTTPQAGGNFDMNQRFIGVATIKDLGTVTTGTTIDLNSFGNWFKVTLGANVAFTVTAPTGLNGRWELWLVQDATGARVPTWPANFVWPEGEPSWASMTSGQAVKITVSWDGTNNVAIGTTPY